MHIGAKRRLWGLLVGSLLVAQPLAATAVAQETKTTQVPPKAAEAPMDALDAAAHKVREGRIDEALEMIKRSAAQHPEWAPSRLILARLMLAAGQGPPGRLALERAAAETPDHPEIYLTLGTMALADRRFSDARLNFEHALALSGSGHWDAETVRNVNREAHAGLAAAGEARDDWKAAERHLNELIKLDPENGQARMRLGRVLFHLGKPDEAYTTLTLAAKVNPTLEPAAVSMGWLYSQKGEPKKAEEWFDYALKVDPHSARVHLARTAWLLEQGRAAAARPEIEEAVKLQPKLREAQWLRALVAWHLRDLPATAQILEPLHRDSPGDSAVANLLALALLEQDDAAKRSRGLQLAEDNARQFPRSHDIMATHGWALYRAGKRDLAEQKLRIAVQGVRTTPDIAYFLARVLSDKGQTEAAKRLLESATKFPVSFAHRSDADSLLKSLTK